MKVLRKIDKNCDGAITKGYKMQMVKQLTDKTKAYLQKLSKP